MDSDEPTTELDRLFELYSRQLETVSHEELIRVAASALARLAFAEGTSGSAITPALAQSARGTAEAQELAAMKAKRTQQARDRANARWAHDPKKKAKLMVYARWSQWQLTPERYRSKASFIRAMLDLPGQVLESQKNMETWISQWEKGVPME